MESSRTHFEVPWPQRSSLWPWLKASNPQKLPSTVVSIFQLLEFCSSPEKKNLKTLIFGNHLKNYFEDLFSWRTLAPVSLASRKSGLGLKRVCSKHKNFLWLWPRALGP